VNFIFSLLSMLVSSQSSHQPPLKKGLDLPPLNCAMGTLMGPEAHLAWMRHWRR
jgi:hypothetical protein